MSPKPKHELAREHLARGMRAIDEGDVVVAITHRGRRSSCRRSRQMRAISVDGLDLLADDARSEMAWNARIERDRVQVRRVVSDDLRWVIELIVERSVAAGAEAVALTGSTARGWRTPVSDLDLHVIGRRPALDGIAIDVDVHVTTADVLCGRLRAGDDYVQWTLRFGLVLFDTGALRDAAVELVASATWPSAERKLAQVRRMLRLADEVVASGDREAAIEQVRGLVTGLARWRLLAAGAFPLSRAELPDQLQALGEGELAAVLERCIHGKPTIRELQAYVGLGDALAAGPERALVR